MESKEQYIEKRRAIERGGRRKEIDPEGERNR